MASRKFTIELTLSTKDGIGNYPDAPRIYAGLTQIMAKDPDIWVDCLGGTPYDIVVTDPEGRKQSFGSIKESWGIIGKDEGHIKGAAMAESINYMAIGSFKPKDGNWGCAICGPYDPNRGEWLCNITNCDGKYSSYICDKHKGMTIEEIQSVLYHRLKDRT